MGSGEMTRPDGGWRRILRRGGHRRARAFTLVESMMAVLIVSGVLVASLGTFGAIARARQMQVERAQAFGLAERMMSEVVQCRYDEPSGGVINPGPDAGETRRALFDDVDDYENWSAAPQLRDGTALPGYSGWLVKVKVRYVTPAAPDSTSNDSTVGLKRIQVSVSTPSGAKHELWALRSAGGAYE